MNRITRAKLPLRRSTIQYLDLYCQRSAANNACTCTCTRPSSYNLSSSSSSISSLSLSSSSSFRAYSSSTIIKQQDKDKDSNSDTSDSSSSTVSLSPNDLKLAMEVANEVEEGIPSSSSSLSSSSIPSEFASFNLDNIPGTSKGGSRKLAIIYTCNVCNTRSAKKFTEHAYNHGVVLVRCPSCENLHLIADRLDYFPEDIVYADEDNNNNDGGDSTSSGSGSGSDSGEKKKGWDIEMFMKKIGKEDNIKVVMDGDNNDVLEVTVEDMLGETLMDDIQQGKGGNDDKRKE